MNSIPSQILRLNKWAQFVMAEWMGSPRRIAGLADAEIDRLVAPRRLRPPNNRLANPTP
jgi:hypothetical protein